MDRIRISLISDFLLELTTSPQCPTPQPIPVNGLLSMARSCHVDSFYAPVTQNPCGKQTLNHPIVTCSLDVLTSTLMHLYILQFVRLKFTHKYLKEDYTANIHFLLSALTYNTHRTCSTHCIFRPHCTDPGYCHWRLGCNGFQVVNMLQRVTSLLCSTPVLLSFPLESVTSGMW